MERTVKTFCKLPIALFFLFLISPFSLADTDKQVSYHRLAEIPIGGKGGWDYLNVDPDSHRLYVSHSDRIVVVDTETNRVIKEILDTPGIHGVALATDLKKGFSSNGKEGTVSVINLETLTSKAKIKVGENPDAILYEPTQHEIYAFNGRSKSVSIIDAENEQVIATVGLPGKPEFAAVDTHAHRVFVNIEDKNEVIALDTQNHSIFAKWELEKCDSPSGLAIDLNNHRLFSVCENETMVMVDTSSGRTIASIPTGKGTDGVAFDPSLMLALSSNGASGTVTVAQEKPPETLALVKNVKTQVGARTIALDPKNHQIYLPTAEFEPIQKGQKRPKVLDGTQKVLVYGP